MQIREDGYLVAVVGATGAVGREMVKVLEASDVPVRGVRLFSSLRGAGEEIAFEGETLIVEALPDEPPTGVDVALFSAGSTVSEAWAPRFAEAGALVIDNSAAFRMDPAVPLVVPEVNPEAAFRADSPGGRGIIANPNCSTIQLVVVLKPLSDAFGLERVVVSTYQSVSGAGQEGVDELSEQVVALFNQREAKARVMPHPIAFNLIPAIGPFLDNGYTEEEWKLVQESRKILGLPGLRVSPTAVRVPTFSCHGEAVNVTCSRKVTPKAAAAAFHNAEGIVIDDMPAEQVYPMPFPLGGSDHVHVGRIRQDPDDDRALNLWVVADNLRKGAASNAVQILELLHEGPE